MRLLPGFLLMVALGAAAAEPSVEQRVDALMAKMTLEEKVGQLHQLSGVDFTGPGGGNFDAKRADIAHGKVGSMLNVKGVAETRAMQALAMKSRLKIPLLFAQDVIHGYKTVLPVPLGEAASWDMAAIERSAQVAAREAAASGIHWTFAPMVDIARDPRWGRVMEGAGEDPYLGARIAQARVRGFQGSKLGGTASVMATAKHFAGYGAALAGRDYNSVDMSEQQLFETYLPPFKAALDAGAASFMNSFNTLNGVPATGNAFLLRDVLKGRWQFGGVVVSDWSSIAEMVSHGYAEDLADAAQKAMNAGSDIDMEGYAYTAHLAAAVRSGKVAPALVGDAVRRVLTKKFELGLFDDPYRFSDPARERAVLNDPAHRAIARDMARKSLVLLKNEDALLPLKKNARIAVVGPFADARRDLEGGWIVQSDPEHVVSLIDGMRSHGSDVRFGEAAARDADVIVLALGETWDLTGEAKSRTELGLPASQIALYDALRATGKPVVVVLLGGRPLIFNHIADTAPAIVFAWFPGSEGGNAIADVLFGDYNPAGKLPIGFPRSVGQLPMTYAHLSTGRPVLDPANVVYRSAYIDAPNTPRYAFGHGLSYTTFRYSGLAVSSAAMHPQDKVDLSFTLTNTGAVAGEEVVQFYLRDLVASVARPVMELKGFQKVSLQPGEQRRLHFVIDKETLSFFNAQLQWGAEPGRFELMIGAASDDVRLRGQLDLLAR